MRFVVLALEPGALPADPPHAYVVDARDCDEAETKVECGDPGCEVVWCVEGSNVELALNDYYGD